jgi:hypothetical protein
MTANAPSFTKEHGILRRAMKSRRKPLSTAAAKALLQVKLDKSDVERMHVLAQKNQNDDLTTEEQAELQSYMQVGMLLDLMQAQARVALTNK